MDEDMDMKKWQIWYLPDLGEDNNFDDEWSNNGRYITVPNVRLSMCL